MPMIREIGYGFQKDHQGKLLSFKYNEVFYIKSRANIKVWWQFKESI